MTMSLATMSLGANSVPDDLYNTLGSMKMTGLGSRMALSSRPLAWMGDRGITIYQRRY